jgi:DNA-binding XRE family transcriptional regulator
MQLSIKAARVNANLTQRELANIVGVTTQTVNSWENGYREPKVSQAKALCDALGVQMDDIFFPKITN